jgi:hypothetical protein
MPSPSTALRSLIEPWAEALLQNPLAVLARSGRLPPRALGLYLVSLRYLFASSQHTLRLATERSAQLGDDKLTEFFRRKSREEVGHDHWATDDLTHLPASTTDRLEPARSVERLVELQKSAIAQHPLCFVAYILWAEYFSILVGDSWLDALETSGYARTQVTAISKHLELDRHHAVRVLQEIDELDGGTLERRALAITVERACALFEAFCEEICAVAAEAA